MPEKLRWVDKVLEVFLKEIEHPPQDNDELTLQRKLITLLQYRLNGLDHRKAGMLAADLYRLIHATRARVVEDMARVAAKEMEGH